MEDVILLSQLNDFVFCPISIYFHNLYGDMDKTLYQRTAQIAGAKAHEAIDNRYYSTRKSILQGIEVYSDVYKLSGKIDLYDVDRGLLIERKKRISQIYDGYVYQLYGQYFGLVESGYDVKRLQLHSLDDNKTYPILLPAASKEWLEKFENIILEMRYFDMEHFEQNNEEKCKNCIYEPACDRSCSQKEIDEKND